MRDESSESPSMRYSRSVLISRSMSEKKILVIIPGGAFTTTKQSMPVGKMLEVREGITCPASQKLTAGMLTIPDLSTPSSLSTACASAIKVPSYSSLMLGMLTVISVGELRARNLKANE
jgi:hypothetical protein